MVVVLFLRICFLFVLVPRENLLPQRLCQSPLARGGLSPAAAWGRAGAGSGRGCRGGGRGRQ